LKKLIDRNLLIVIQAPAFSMKSGGIYALHALAADLHGMGHQVALYSNGTFPGSPVSLIGEKGLLAARSQGITIIAIYPEITLTNFLSADYCVWWLLNFPGFINKKWNGNDSWADRVICYDPVFAMQTRCDGKLTFPLYDPDFFFPNPTVPKTEVVCYLNRIRYTGQKRLEAPVKVTKKLVPDDQLTYAELRELFWRTRLVISWERSGTCAIAQMCGVPIVYMPSPILQENPDVRWGGYGSCWDYSEEGLAAATRSVKLVPLIHRDLRLLWPAALEREVAEWVAGAKRKPVQVGATISENVTLPSSTPPPA